MNNLSFLIWNFLKSIESFAIINLSQLFPLNQVTRV